MKISSQGKLADIMSVGVNVSDQAKDATTTQSFQSYIQQSASGKNYQQVSDTSTVFKNQNTQSEDVKGQSIKTEAANGQNNSTASDEQISSYASDRDTKAVTSENDDTKSTSADDLHGDDTDTEAAVQDVLAAVIPLEQLAGLLDSIQIQLQELLGLDAEEMNQLISQLDMQPADLLSTDAQQQLLLASQDAQPVDLLTDEELSGLLDRMNSLVEETITASQISASTLQSAIEQVNAIENANTEQEILNPADAGMENTTELSESENIRFTVDLEQTEANSHQDNQQEQTDLGTMRDQVVSQLNQSVGQLNEVSAVEETVTPADIVNQVVEEIKLVARQDTTSLELQLYPEHLGKVAIQVSSRNGIVTAQITTENEMARAALEGSIETLKETFQNQQLKVEAIEVMVATSDFSQEQFQNQQTNQDSQPTGKGNRRIHLDELDSETELTEEEQLNVDMMRQEGRSVDYIA